MEKNKLRLNGAQREIIKAYYHDSLFTLILDVIVILTLMTVYILGSDIKGMELFIVCVAVIYILFSVLLQHRKNILLFIDNKKHTTETLIVKVLSEKEELAWNGHLWHSPVSNFFPKDMNVGKRKILVELPDGKKTCIRTLMSNKRNSLFRECFLKEGAEYQIQIFKRSKVLIEITEKNCKDKKRFEQINKFNNTI